jgi:hypothetical protein
MPDYQAQFHGGLSKRQGILRLRRRFAIINSDDLKREVINSL